MKSLGQVGCALPGVSLHRSKASQARHTAPSALNAFRGAHRDLGTDYLSIRMFSRYLRVL